MRRDAGDVSTGELASSPLDLPGIVRANIDRLVASALMVGGVVLGVAGWFGASNTPYPSAEMPYIISGGGGALFFLGLGAVVLIGADLRDEWRQLDRLEIELDEFEALLPAESATVEPDTGQPVGAHS